MTLKILEIGVVVRRVVTDVVITLRGGMQEIASMMCGGDMIHTVLLRRKVFVLPVIETGCSFHPRDILQSLTHFPVLTSYVVK